MTVTEVYGVMKRAKPNVSITILNRAIYFQYLYTSILQWFIDKGFGFTFQPELNKQSISYVNNQKCILVNFLSQNGIDLSYKHIFQLFIHTRDEWKHSEVALKCSEIFCYLNASKFGHSCNSVVEHFKVSNIKLFIFDLICRTKSAAASIKPCRYRLMKSRKTAIIKIKIDFQVFSKC